MKVAIIHYWLVGMRGGEKVLEELLALYPQAVIFTHVYDPDSVSERIRAHEVRQTFIGRLPGARRHYQKYLPLMPRALEEIDLRAFDLVISSESGPTKGIIPRPDATHVCYCHSPMRYIWDQYHVYRDGAGWLTRAVMPALAHRLRIWDVTSAARVDRFIANSSFIAARIRKYYRREAVVIAPPVAVEEFAIAETVGEHYLLAGELVSYKRPDLAIAAFNASGRKLVVVGDGEMRARLEAQAGPNITFRGWLPFDQLKQEFARARALIFPGEEDFGIVPVEVMASGRPVVALRRGGALDYVVPGETGVFFDHQDVASLNAAVTALEADPRLTTRPEALRRHAGGFGRDVFRSRIQAQIDDALARNGTGSAARADIPAVS